MGWLILSIIFALTFLVSLPLSLEETIQPNTIAALVLMLAIAVLSFVKYRNSKNGKTAAKRHQSHGIKAGKQRAKEVASQTLQGFHMAGLPVAEKTNCSIHFHEDNISITGGGNEFNLLLPKVTDLNIKTEAEIQQQYVSSVGGAVGGAILFGPLGAMVGGRAKRKESKTLDHFFIITYLKDSLEIGYLSFEISEIWKAQKIVKQYRPSLRVNARQIINL